MSLAELVELMAAELKAVNDLNEKLARVLDYIFSTEEEDFEQICGEYGVDSTEASNHVYNLARDLWVEYKIDFIGKEK